ncbi:MAG: prepilin peptidase [Subtercola sp.]|nr:prepilin peptidase [Subtercola sp.]
MPTLVLLLHLCARACAIATTVYLAAVTVPLFVADITTLRLPNRLLLPGFAVAAGALAASGFIEAANPAVLLGFDRTAPPSAFAAAVAVFLGLRMVGAVGMGDVKLAGLLAAGLGFLPPSSVAPALAAGLLVSFVLAGAAAVIALLRAARLLAFGPFLLSGYWVAALIAVAGTTMAATQT